VGRRVGFEGVQEQKVIKPDVLENKSEALSPAVLLLFFSFFFFSLFSDMLLQELKFLLTNSKRTIDSRSDNGRAYLILLW
jgi:hypothetical protein